MSLQPTITVAQSRDGEILEVTSTTGTYDPTINPNGFGTARVAGVITANSTTDQFNLVGHGLALNEVITITDVGSLTGLNLDEAYYVIFIDNDNFSLSATPNGAAINFGGTTGTFDFNVGWKLASEVARTIFKVQSYLDDEIRESDYLTSGTFIPKNTTTDTTTINSIVANGDGTAEVIDDAVYAVTMIPIWEPSFSAVFNSATLVEVSGVDLADQFGNAQYLYVSDGGLDYLLEIASIALVGGTTQIVLAASSSFNGNTYPTTEWGLGIPATNYVNAYYNTYKCYQEQVSSLIPSSIGCVGVSPSPSDEFINSQYLNLIIQGAIGNLEAGNYQGAENLIEAGVKRCNVIANQDNNACGCH